VYAVKQNAKIIQLNGEKSYKKNEEDLLTILAVAIKKPFKKLNGF
jgi:hypothetical protein